MRCSGNVTIRKLRCGNVTDPLYQPPYIKVETAMGLIRGLDLPEAHGFYRIPFGKAPTDDMRQDDVLF